MSFLDSVFVADDDYHLSGSGGTVTTTLPPTWFPDEPSYYPAPFGGDFLAHSPTTDNTRLYQGQNIGDRPSVYPLPPQWRLKPTPSLIPYDGVEDSAFQQQPLTGTSNNGLVLFAIIAGVLALAATR